MSSAGATPRPSPATEADLLAADPDGPRYELIDGELVEKESSPRHSLAQVVLSAALHPSYGRRGGGGGQGGGWWILSEVYVRLGSVVLVPDLAGWRRERLPALPDSEIIDTRPDWVCEIVSAGHAGRDFIRKRRLYHQQQVPHYWIIDPRNEALMVLQWTPQGYLEILLAEKGDFVRAEPFADIELVVAELFG